MNRLYLNELCKEAHERAIHWDKEDENVLTYFRSLISCDLGCESICEHGGENPK